MQAGFFCFKAVPGLIPAKHRENRTQYDLYHVDLMTPEASSLFILHLLYIPSLGATLETSLLFFPCVTQLLLAIKILLYPFDISQPGIKHTYMTYLTTPSFYCRCFVRYGRKTSHKSRKSHAHAPRKRNQI